MAPVVVSLAGMGMILCRMRGLIMVRVRESIDSNYKIHNLRSIVLTPWWKIRLIKSRSSTFGKERKNRQEALTMKKVKGIFEEICSRKNIRNAIGKACRNHKNDPVVINIMNNIDECVEEIHEMLVNGTFESSEYTYDTRIEGGKVRNIAKVGFYPDRIIHWCIMNVTAPIFKARFINCTFGAIEGRGTHRALKMEKRFLKDKEGTAYVLKIDVHHFFESIDKDILMSKLERIYKEKEVLNLFSKIIYGYPRTGLPIGNLTSQYLANLYLSDLDHYMKEVFHAKYYLRYMDDIVILGKNKSWLRRALNKVRKFLEKEKLELNPKYQISPVDDRGVDFVGYRAFHGFVLLRTRIKRNLYRVVNQILKILQSGGTFTERMRCQCASYNGILKWCNSYRLRRRTLDRVEQYVKQNSAECS